MPPDPATAAAAHPLLALPFVLLLGAIAVAPFVDHHWWERHYAKVSVALGGLSALYYLFWLRDYARLLRVAHDYVGFMALIGSLYVISGGIHIRVAGRRATPGVNALFLLGGAVLANVLGTTGASVLLIRPYLRMNRGRAEAFHVVFFIFIVSNVGGCLTPLGDPPLFLGFLKGVPFWWVIRHCGAAWLVGVGSLLVIFYWRDRGSFRRASAGEPPRGPVHDTWHFDGLHNLAFLALVLGGVFIERPAGLREGLLLAAALGSYLTTRRRVYAANQFAFGPIEEVGWLFVGIFLTMIPVLDYLAARSPGAAIGTDMEFFWLTGGLSGVLDNAPTYLALLATALGNHGLSLDSRADVARFLVGHPGTLRAISLGAVFFGAMTYIGNGPNFMVRAIAEQAQVRPPGFFRYIWRYALPVLVPVFFLVSLLFFSRWRVF